ncbi:AAA family ATPase [Leuconostoc citreum]|nr:AAA family ATPase [Leuconostoc citreum]
MKYIKEFGIDGLYGYRDFHSTFKKDFTIFVGENGLGKTSIMRILFYTLKKDFEHLKNIEFSTIDILFSGNNHFSLSKTAIEEYINEYKNINNYRTNSSLFKLRQIIQSKLNLLYMKFDLHEFNNIIDKKIQARDFDDIIEEVRKANLPTPPLHIILREVERVRENFNLTRTPESIELSRFVKFLDSNMNDIEFLYFPTYRRLSDDLHQMSIQSEGFEGSDIDREIEKLIGSDNEIVKFGMGDVQARIDLLLSKIRKQSLEAFNELNVKILSQYTSPDKIENKSTSVDIKKLNIVLQRLGNRIDESLKEKIKLQLKRDQEDKNFKLLKNFVLLLLDTYKQSEELEKRILSFTEEVNKFLEDKYFSYDPAALEITLKLKKTEKNVELSNLSSGEKQVVSLFARIFLHDSENLYIFFDEPELSLSIKWQEKLIPSMRRAHSLKYLVAITHSPFIFSDINIRNNAVYMKNKIEVQN